MHLIVVGLSYGTAPAEVREPLSFSKEQLANAFTQLRNHVPDGVILSTCHRTEIYTYVEDKKTGIEGANDFLASYHNYPIETFKPHLYSYQDSETVQHLFRVASGADSMVLGEPQILGQVRQAFSSAIQHGMDSSVLSALFRQAKNTGKRVRNSTAIGEFPLSTCHAAVTLARKACDPTP